MEKIRPKSKAIQWKYQVGDIITNSISSIQITEQVFNDGAYSQSKKKIAKYYLYHCLKCGYDSDYDHMMEEDNLLRGHGCICCGRRLTCKGINDVATIRPDVAKYFTNIEDAYKYSFGSDVLVDMTCPCCKCSDMYRIADVSKRGFKCRFCSDGLSYPEKFVQNALYQSGEEFIIQLSKNKCNWCQDYRYDIFLPKKNAIIEINGSQHYQEFVWCKLDYKKQKETDRIKRNLALENNIDIYIELDCRYSDKEWIQNSINQQLCKLINTDLIDYDACNKNATKSKIIEVCEYYMQNNRPSTTILAQVFNLNRTTTLKYLNKGAKLGICDYDPAKVLHGYHNTACNDGKIECWKNNEYLGMFDGVPEFVIFVEEQYDIKLDKFLVRSVCRGKYTHTRGFTCKYVETK